MHSLNFDSQSEENFFTRNSTILTASTNSFFPDTFKDVDGCIFKAKPDFTYNDIYIEYKSYQLNTQKSQSHAVQSMEKQQYRVNYKNRNIINLDNGWNHSVFKQGIVARKYSNRFLLVFKNNTKLSTQSKNKMGDESINWCFEFELLSSLQELTSIKTLH